MWAILLDTFLQRGDLLKPFLKKFDINASEILLFFLLTALRIKNNDIRYPSWPPKEHNIAGSQIGAVRRALEKLKTTSYNIELQHLWPAKSGCEYCLGERKDEHLLTFFVRSITHHPVYPSSRKSTLMTPLLSSNTLTWKRFSMCFFIGNVNGFFILLRVKNKLVATFEKLNLLVNCNTSRTFFFMSFYSCSMIAVLSMLRRSRNLMTLRYSTV